MRMCSESHVRKVASILEGIRCGDSTISFSGGLDSSIVAYLSRESGPELITVGFEGSRDIENAREVAGILGINLRIVYLTRDELLDGIGELASHFPELSAVEISFELPLLFSSKHASRGRICTGQGADELFGGYAKYLRDPGMMREDVENLLRTTLPRERRIAEMFGKELVTPFTSEDFVKISHELPEDCKIRNGVRKWILREAARRVGVPEIIAMREKKAAQYGSGIWREMRREAKKRGMTVDSLVRSIAGERD